MTDAPAIQPARLKRIFKRLLDTYSPPGKEEESLEYLEGVFQRAGVPVTMQEVDENRANLLVLPPEPVDLVLVGHIDTVTAYDLENYGFEEDDGVVSGLGAADMKGGCAAMVEATLAMWEAGRPGAALALVVGEEEDGDGAAALVAEHHWPWALIGEPTSLNPCLGHYGYVEVQVRARGQRRHASLARPSANPVDGLLRLLLKISGHLDTQRPEVIYNIRDIFSSPEGFVVPEFCEAWLDLHLPPKAPLGEITAELEELADWEKTRPPVELELRFVTIQAGYSLPERGPVAEGLRDVFQRHGLTWRPETFRSHSDANQLWAAGIKPLLMGPGSIEQAHSPEEWVSLAEVVRAAEVYLELGFSLA